MVCHRMFSDFERTQYSPARELMAIDLAVNSFCKEFTNKKIQMRSDSQNAVSILKRVAEKSICMSSPWVCF